MPGTSERLQKKISEILPGYEYNEVLGSGDIILEYETKTKDPSFTAKMAEFSEVIKKLADTPDINVIKSYVSMKTRKMENQQKTTAYVFLNIVPQHYENILDYLFKVENIIEVNTLLGDYDVVVKTSAPLNKLSSFLDEIVHAPGIKKSTTRVPTYQLNLCQN